MWNTPTTDDVLEEFTPQESAALNSLQGGNKQLVGILEKTIASARGSINAGGNDLDVDGTIPDQVIPHVIAIARWRWLASFSALKSLQTDVRRDAYRDGLKALDKIAEGHPKVEAPANPQPSVASLVTLPSVGKRPHQFTRHSEDGI